MVETTVVVTGDSLDRVSPVAAWAIVRNSVQLTPAAVGAAFRIVVGVAIRIPAGAETKVTVEEGGVDVGATASGSVLCDVIESK